ncbi:hypothetical protein [Thiohalobacter sp.]|uniref:hypothetical protein n=1 Tax=Thiohalobacter sp. TaxID=2025948 RepID=UPI00261F9E47|nr:hypothetical protein [Thiohalobacter sp.]
MSASDDTQKKLIDSIRKTRQTAAAKPAAAKAAGSSASRSAASGSTSKRRTRKAPAKSGGGKSAPASQGYQAGRRVWPD